MRSVLMWLVLSWAALSGGAMAQDLPPAAPSEPAPPGMDAPVEELQISALAWPSPELIALRDTLVKRLEAEARDYADEAVERWRVRRAADEAITQEAAGNAHDATSVLEALDARLSEQRRVVEGTAARLSVVVSELEARGQDAAAARQYLGSVRRLMDASDPNGASVGGVGEPTLEERVAAEARRVQSDPPVHERPEPWNVPVTEFLNELQPLSKPQIEERVAKWLELLQGEIRKRNRLSIAAEQAEDPVLRQALLDSAEAQSAIIRKVVERTDAALNALAVRGGDVSEQRRYLSNATEVAIDVSNVGVVYSRALAWLRSPDGGIALGVRVGTFLAIILGFWIIAGLMGRVVTSAVKRLPKASNLLREFLAGGARRVTMLIGFIVAISQLGVNIGPFVAAIGAAGLVVGLALQGTLSNFASGILILIYRPYDVGDVIEAGGVSGTVEAMNLVSTRIATVDNQVRFVPNNQIWGGVITNINGRDTRRVDMTVGVGRADDLAKAERIIREVVAGHPKVLATPEPVVKVNEFSDSGVRFIVRPWARVGDYGDVYWDITRAIKERFDAEGVNTPPPAPLRRDLHLAGPIEVKVNQG